jgi:hypothetical protein
LGSYTLMYDVLDLPKQYNKAERDKG